jgi:hypothetical protein
VITYPTRSNFSLAVGGKLVFVTFFPFHPAASLI